MADAGPLARFDEMRFALLPHIRPELARSIRGSTDGEWRMIGAPDPARAAIIASEPLTRDHSTWHAVPMQHLVYVRRTQGSPRVELVPLDV